MNIEMCTIKLFSDNFNYSKNIHGHIRNVRSVSPQTLPTSKIAFKFFSQAEISDI